MPAKPPVIEAGMPISAIAPAIARCASLSACPGARLKEIVVATKGPWWLTESGVSASPNFAKADNGIMVSLLVETEAPAEAVEWPVAASELIARLRAESAAIVEAEPAVAAVAA